jgi:hypothetical protein
MMMLMMMTKMGSYRLLMDNLDTLVLFVFVLFVCSQYLLVVPTPSNYAPLQ